MNDFDVWPTAARGLALLVPLVFGLGAALLPRADPLRRLGALAGVALALALAAGLGRALLPGGAVPAPLARVRLDVVAAVMLPLVGTVGFVVARYARAYLDGDPSARRFGRWLLATLAAVTSLLLVDNLLALALAWMATSLALHQLLTHFGDRPAALVAAHKKFIVSRLADACLLAATALIGRTVGSVDLDAIDAWAAAHPTLPPSLQAAAVLLVLAASLKSAQLPFHGWLTQVMEAPTPVSALLHAGVVNLGGFLMIRLAPLMTRAPAAQALLVLIGLTTAVVATLVATTRVTVKVALAWSTCAQMGLMLVQCGLGAWHLALLHLVAHSLYKAYAFLSAGGAVDDWRARALAPAPSAPSTRRRVAAAAVVLTCVAAAALAARSLGGARDPATAPLTWTLALSLLALASTDRAPLWAVAARSLGVSALYFAWHEVAGRALHVAPPGATAAIGWTVVALALSLVFAVQTAVRAWPDGAFARAIHPPLFAGLYLDERFTRLTFYLWAPRLRSRSEPVLGQRGVAARGV